MFPNAKKSPPSLPSPVAGMWDWRNHLCKPAGGNPSDPTRVKIAYDDDLTADSDSIRAGLGYLNDWSGVGVKVVEHAGRDSPSSCGMASATRTTRSKAMQTPGVLRSTWKAAIVPGSANTYAQRRHRLPQAQANPSSHTIIRHRSISQSITLREVYPPRFVVRVRFRTTVARLLPSCGNVRWCHHLCESAGGYAPYCNPTIAYLKPNHRHAHLTITSPTWTLQSHTYATATHQHLRLSTDETSSASQTQCHAPAGGRSMPVYLSPYTDMGPTHQNHARNGTKAVHLQCAMSVYEPTLEPNLKSLRDRWRVCWWSHVA